MTATSTRHPTRVSVIVALLATAAFAADTTVRAPAQKSTTARSSSGKGPLPDPTLLDGSSQPAEKKSEQGMIGDFELPGDENVKDGKVGGQSGAPGGKGQQQQQPGLQVNVPMPGLPGLPGGKEQSSGAQSAGGGGLNLPDPTKQGGGAGQQGAASMSIPTGAQSGAGQPQSGAAGGADGKPDGVQVGQLQGEGGAAGQDASGGGNGPNSKPAPIAIGDSAMRIEPSVNPASLPAGQQGQIAGQTQQHEKGTGSGGKGSGGAQSGNRVERGKAMPAGL